MPMNKLIYIMSPGQKHEDGCLPEDGSGESTSFMIKMSITDILSSGLRQS